MAARALADLAGSPGDGASLERLANALVSLQPVADAPLSAAASLVHARQATGAPLSTNALRLVAEALSGDAGPEVVDDLRRGHGAASAAGAPLSTAFSGVALMTRALGARHGRRIEVAVEGADLDVPETRIDAWRQAAHLITNLAAELSRQPAISLTFKVKAFRSAIVLETVLPADMRLSAADSIADALIRALDGDGASFDASPADALEQIAASLGGSLSLELLEGGRQRLSLVARRDILELTAPKLRSPARRPVRRAAPRRAA